MKRKINIMQMTYGMGFGGLQKVIINLCNYLDKDRYNLMVCCLLYTGEFAEILKKKGIPVFFFKDQRKLSRYLRSLEVSKLLKNYKVDIIHSHNTCALIDGLIAGKIARIPVHIHTDHVKQYPDKKRYMLAERIASYFIDKMVAVSEQTKKDLVKWEHINPQKISVIYNGLNITDNLKKEHISRVKNEFGIADKEMVIGSVGRIEYQKGYDLLLEAIPHIIKRTKNVRFLIVGGGREEKALKIKSKDLGISEKVIFTGWRMDASLIISFFDVFVMTSHFEGMPLVLLEAMALKKPIISTTVGGVPEMVKDGENGILLNKRDPELLAKKITNLLKDERLKNSLAQNGYSIYKNNYTVEKMIQNYHCLYEKYINLKLNGFEWN